jgi:metal transporter CNNM
VCREIIDESDVFIDVHKAIRRLTPAPKSRVPKGRFVEEPPSLPTHTEEDNTVDLSNGNPLSPPSGGGTSDVTVRRASTGITHPPAPTFLLRNKNGEVNPATPNEMFTKMGADEIRQHLKHLGPSNLASRPRQTRYQSVKIKAPGVSPTRSGFTDSDSGRRMSADHPQRQLEVIGYQGGIGAGLLQSAGKDAKDGVHVLKTGYGTIGDHTTVHTNVTKLVVPEVDNEHQARTSHPTSPFYTTPNRSKPSSVHSYETRPIDHQKGPSRISGPARSGSITEQIIDVNGIRKVVLHATSSSGSSDTEIPTGISPAGSLRHAQGDAANDDDATQPNPSENEDGPNSRGGKKKRRRRRKKPDGKDGEQQPLLS